MVGGGRERLIWGEEGGRGVGAPDSTAVLTSVEVETKRRCSRMSSTASQGMLGTARSGAMRYGGKEGGYSLSAVCATTGPSFGSGR